MDRNIRYEMVASQDFEDERRSGAAQAPTTSHLAVALPPDLEQAAAMSLPMGMVDDIPPPKADFSAPPPYELATKLPSYEEAQQQKMQEQYGENSTGHHPNNAPPLTFLTIDSDLSDCSTETSLLGSDFTFFSAFLVAFLFNWIGFLLLMCFCHTIAARYGALSGFGLSLAKWTLIVKHSTDLASRENIWLWWLIMAFGLLICARAIIQYLHIKREWSLLSRSAQERLVFFY
ncbi:NEDD4 family-interacting protein 2 isoform X2 [Neocloeon triangulifer]|uniref:NEDD4 family-interacting protein 2 isoform X2 n=1 Tax=Neocloeon triangulifer TaxID=2078957 RepID=UPI00286ED151|nr:NEDD4 family-interacting protein 2 isoform X2 [Neocloeon triangulifer]